MVRERRRLWMRLGGSLAVSKREEAAILGDDSELAEKTLRTGSWRRGALLRTAAAISLAVPCSRSTKSTGRGTVPVISAWMCRRSAVPVLYIVEAMKRLDLKSSTFYRKVGQMEEVR